MICSGRPGNRVSRCDRCGTCLPVCPLFGVKGIEATSARGKNAIARALAAGGIEPSREALDIVNFCLLVPGLRRYLSGEGSDRRGDGRRPPAPDGSDRRAEREIQT